MTRLLAGFARRRVGDAWPQGLLESAAVTAKIWEEAGGPIGSALRGSLHGRRRELNSMGISPSDVFRSLVCLCLIFDGGARLAREICMKFWQW